MEQKQAFSNESIKDLLKNYKTLWALNHLGSLAMWDRETHMPNAGIKERAEALSKLSSLSQKIFLDEEFVSLINKANNQYGDLNDYEKGIVRVLKRKLHRYQNLPTEFLEEHARITNQASSVWSKAKEQDDFAMFSPYLERIVELERKKAEYLGYDHVEGGPYDVLLDEFEEGLSSNQVNSFFSELVPGLRKLISYVEESEGYTNSHDLEQITYDIKQGEALNKRILQLLRHDPRVLRLDVSSHPFTTSMGHGDVRITTRYEGYDFARFVSSTIHEFGHALYEMQADSALAFTPIRHSESHILHESQSRFWENVVGRSKSFLSTIYNDIKKLDPKIAQYSIDEVHRYFNLVRPSLIRVDADELTYHFHILARFEIEQSLIQGNLKPKEVPHTWAQKYKDHLGQEPPNDATGALQDIHWSIGGIGYFPTYSMGTALSGLIKKKMEEEMGYTVDDMVLREDDSGDTGIKIIQDWLKNKIHNHGSAYTMSELLNKSFGTQLKASHFLEYAEKKYKEIY